MRRPRPQRVRVETSLDRRELMKMAIPGLAAAAFSASTGELFAQPGAAQKPQAAAAVEKPAGRTPISLIIDDGAPIDPLFYEIPGYETPFLVPAEFTKRVAETFERCDMRGKFTIIPMPSCLGRIDKSLKRVPPKHLEEFLQVVRQRIAPRFDITPEFLTHLRAYNLKSGGYQHVYEDVWISRAPLEEVVQYFSLAFEILNNVGLPATGITSPWSSGNDVEKKYAQAVGEAQWKVHQRKLTWYFLHCAGAGKPRQCSVEYEDRTRGQAVVSVPANAPDIFWSMELPTSDEQVKHINRGIDRLLSPDGRTGRIPQLIQSGHPVVLLTHWQSLYGRGTGLGLEGLARLGERINRLLGKQVEWVSCCELARRCAAARRT